MSTPMSIGIRAASMESVDSFGRISKPRPSLGALGILSSLYGRILDAFILDCLNETRAEGLETFVMTTNYYLDIFTGVCRRQNWEIIGQLFIFYNLD